MKVTPCDHGLDTIVGHSTGPRTPGLHLSDILTDLFERLEPKRYTGGEPDRTRMEAGLSWELMLEEGLGRRLGAFRPGEIVSSEGIIMSPDLVIPEGDNVRVGEVKCTWTSFREMPSQEAASLPPKMHKWTMQLLSYMRAMETLLGRFIVFYVNGDYREQREPTLKAWNVDCTRRELDENWKVILTHGRVMGVL